MAQILNFPKTYELPRTFDEVPISLIEVHTREKVRLQDVQLH